MVYRIPGPEGRGYGRGGLLAATASTSGEPKFQIHGGGQHVTGSLRAPNCGEKRQLLESVARTDNVRMAWELAKTRYLIPRTVRRLGHDFMAASRGILPGLDIAMGVLMTGTVTGQANQGIAGGARVVSGIMLGTEAAVSLLAYMKLGFLLEYLQDKTGRVGRHFSLGMHMAWDACGDETLLDAAAEEIAEGYMLLLTFVLEGVVALVARQGMTAAKKRLFNTPYGSNFIEYLEKKALRYLQYPGFARDTGDYLYLKDSAGRPSSAEGWVLRETGKRFGSSETAVTAGLDPLVYVCGFMIPNAFHGTGAPENLFPAERSRYRAYADAFANHADRSLLAQGNGNVYVKTTLEYGRPGNQPTGVRFQFLGRDPQGNLFDLGINHVNLVLHPTMPAENQGSSSNREET